MEIGVNTYTVDQVARTFLNKKNRKLSMDNLPSLNDENSSLQVLKPWYYMDRRVPLPNCKCPFHAKKSQNNQLVLYEYSHAKGCHNSHVMIYKANVSKKIKEESKHLLKGEYNRRIEDLSNKRLRIQEIREEHVKR